MLANPDLDPSASVNRWILAILTFHFDLIPVPGTMHGPDGLLCHHLQPGDKAEPEDDFNDWIDNLYGFLHIINDSPYLLWTQHPTAIFAAEVTDIEVTADGNALTLYNDIP